MRDARDIYNDLQKLIAEIICAWKYKETEMERTLIVPIDDEGIPILVRLVDTVILDWDQINKEDEAQLS